MTQTLPSTVAKPESADPARTRVLILESDRLIKELTMEWLQLAGYEVHCVATAAEIVRLSTLYALARYDVVIADVPAPLKVTREAVRRLNEVMPQTPVIAMSADALAFGRSASDTIAREVGAAAVLVKPFTRETLLNAIHRAVG